MKKYELILVPRHLYRNELVDYLTKVFNDLSEKGYHYQNFLPSESTITQGDISSFILIFEKEVDNKDNDF